MAQREQSGGVRKVVTCVPQSRMQVRLDLQRQQPDTPSVTRGRSTTSASETIAKSLTAQSRTFVVGSMGSSVSTASRVAAQPTSKVIVVRKATLTNNTQQMEMGYDALKMVEVQDRERSETLRADSEYEYDATVNEALARVSAEQQQQQYQVHNGMDEDEMGVMVDHTSQTWPPPRIDPMTHTNARRGVPSSQVATSLNVNAHAHNQDHVMDMDVQNTFDAFSMADTAIENELLSLIGAASVQPNANELELDATSNELLVFGEAPQSATVAKHLLSDSDALAETDDPGVLPGAFDAGYGSHVASTKAERGRHIPGNNAALRRAQSAKTSGQASRLSVSASAPRLRAVAQTSANANSHSLADSRLAQVRTSDNMPFSNVNVYREQPASPGGLSSSQITATSTTTSFSEVDDLSDVVYFENDNQLTDLHDESNFNDMFSPDSAALGMSQAMTNSCPTMLAGYAGDTYLLSPQQGGPLYANLIDPSMIKFDPVLGLAPQGGRPMSYQPLQSAQAHSQAVASASHMVAQRTRVPVTPQGANAVSLNAANGVQASRGVSSHAHSQRLPSAAYASPNTNAAQSPTTSGRRRHSTTTSKQTRVEEDTSEEKMRMKKDIHNTIERRRRVNINERIKELSTMLPRTNEGDFKNHKGNVLKESVDYIRRLQRNEQQLRNANVSLQKRVLELEHFLRQQSDPAGAQAPVQLADDNSFAFLSNVIKSEPSETTSATGLSDADESPEGSVLNDSEQN